MLHDLFTSMHAAAGVVAFACGCAAMWRRSAFPAYFASLVAMVAFMVAAVAVDWAGLTAAPRTIFLALVALGGYLLVRADLARRELAGGADARSPRVVDHIGFTLVALFDGFAVVAVVTRGGPGWLAAVVGVVGVAVGHLTLRRVKRRGALDQVRA